MCGIIAFDQTADSHRFSTVFGHLSKEAVTLGIVTCIQVLPYAGSCPFMRMYVPVTYKSPPVGAVHQLIKERGVRFVHLDHQ